MLLNWMKGTKNKLPILLCLLVLLGVICLCVHIIINNNKSDQDIYYKKMISLSETSGKVNMSDVFDFEFDKAYVANEPYADEKYFLEKLGVSSALDIPTLESGGFGRILFIKNNEVIYDFIFEVTEISILKSSIKISDLESGFYVSSESKIKITCKNIDEKVIQLDFD